MENLIVHQIEVNHEIEIVDFIQYNRVKGILVKFKLMEMDYMYVDIGRVCLLLCI